MSKGREFTGFKRFQFMKAFPKAVKSSGAVSPITLAELIRIPLMIPLKLAGNTTLSKVL
jgi:hypothetical protein